jgi:hypothetical protein
MGHSSVAHLPQAVAAESAHPARSHEKPRGAGLPEDASKRTRTSTRGSGNRPSTWRVKCPMRPFRASPSMPSHEDVDASAEFGPLGPLIRNEEHFPRSLVSPGVGECLRVLVERIGSVEIGGEVAAAHQGGDLSVVRADVLAR